MCDYCAFLNKYKTIAISSTIIHKIANLPRLADSMHFMLKFKMQRSEVT